ncbi:MAG TPA: hypothetical protein VGP44_11830 [Gemmatimonadales bacterium]|nr:hypothetical protein [Gemmatimonadales bacterium]
MGDHIATIILAVVAASPGIFALITKRKALVERTATNQFNTLYDAQNKLVANCQSRCLQLEEELRRTWGEYRTEIAAVRQEHATEIAAFHQKHRIEVETWQRKYTELEAQERDRQDRMEYLEQLLRSAGLLPGRGSDGHRRPEP